MGVSAKDSKLDQLRALREARFESRGGVESRHATGSEEMVVRPHPPEGCARRVSAVGTQNCGENVHPLAGVAPSPRDAKGERQALATTHPRGENDPVVRQDWTAAPPRRKGRCLDLHRHLSYEATKPWVAEGMSRATWYRRRAKARK